MNNLLSNEAKSVLESSIDSGIKRVVDNEGRTQITPAISYKYYDEESDKLCICELSITVTSYQNKMKLSVDLSVDEKIVPEKYTGVKHSIDKIDSNVNEIINTVISTKLSKYNVRPEKIYLKTAGVEPNKKINSINSYGESVACISYYDSITIKNIN